MRAVLQRVQSAHVVVDGRNIAEINSGWLILLGVKNQDSDEDIEYILSKTLNLRGFPDSEGRMNASALDLRKDILIVSQFTLYGDCRKGRRPSFTDSAPPVEAEGIYNKFVQQMQKSGLRVECGQFRAMMQVHLVNDGPVTFILDSSRAL